MSIGDFLSGLFKFRKTSLSVLVILTYVTVILLQEVSVSRSLTPPSDEPEILKDAWEYLQIISSSKHPFTSRENDNVHDYLQSVINILVEDVPYITTSYDKVENHTILINQHDVFNKSNEDTRIIYYESSNLLVKIEGTNPKLPGLLLSAHYDSVPTSFGTTDDGMGIASMLGILQYFADSDSQPLRTLIFNFNNNEEFGLLGAEAFIEHDWFKDVAFFINLEGTGAGGQPILFRGTDKGVLDWYHSVSKPYANSIFQEGFNSGLISSQTDYHVYEKFGLRGIDIAFYCPRSFYHTFKDSIRYTTKGSLWMMMSNVLEVLLDVSYSKDNYDSDLNYSIYFDILNTWYFNFGLDLTFIFNVILLVVIPVVNLILLLIVSKRNTWFIGTRGWFRFPIALSLSYYSVLSLSKYFYKLNPLMLSVNYYYPLVAFFSLSVIISYIILKTNAYLTPVHDQKLIVLLELNFISWVSLVWITVQISNNKNIGGYSLTLFYILTSLATILGLIGLTFRSLPCYKPKSVIVYGSTNEPHNSDADATPVTDSDSGPHVHDIVEETTTENETAANIEDGETTPLIAETSITINHETRDTFMHNLKHKAINSFQYDWILQFITLVPLSVFFIYSEGKIVIDALHETVQESKNFDVAVWEFITAFGLLLSLVIMPFVHKMNFVTVQIMAILFTFGFFKSYTSFSYDESTPMKLRYVKTFDVNSNSSVSNVYGRQGYIPTILEDVPYIDEKDITCVKYNLSGTETCTYVGHRPWLLSGTHKDNEYGNYLNVTVLSDTNDLVMAQQDMFTPLESVIEIEVRGTRQCYVTFNNTNVKFKAPVKMVTIYEEGNSYEDSNTLNMNFNIDLGGKKETVIPNGMSRDKDGNWIFKTMKGIDVFEMHKLPWKNADYDSNKFTVRFQWLPFVYDSDIELIDRLGVNVQCHWSDYNDMITVDGRLYDKVEDYIDLMMFTDVGVVWTNLRPGLVQGMAYVEI